MISRHSRARLLQRCNSYQQLHLSFSESIADSAADSPCVGLASISHPFLNCVELRFGRRFQLVGATARASTSDGFIHSRVCRG